MHIILFEIHNNAHVKNNLTQPFYLRSPSISLTELIETVFALFEENNNLAYRLIKTQIISSIHGNAYFLKT